MDDQNKNLILAIALSGLVVLAWMFLFPPEQRSPDAVPTETSDGIADGSLVPPGATTQAVPGTAAPGAALTRDAAVGATARVAVETPRVTGSISLVGGRLDDLKLKDYRETIDDGSPIVTLLSPERGPDAYYALHGWVPAGDLSFDAVPSADAEWTLAEGATLTPETPVVLEWDNGAGLTFRRTIAVDADYMFTVAQSVENRTGAAVRLAPYGQVARHGLPDTVNFFILHEGVVGKVDGELVELDYDDVTDLDSVVSERGPADLRDVQEAGWIGFTDKYWMTTLIPQEGVPFRTVAKYVDGSDIYTTETRLPALEVAPGATVASTSRLFAGAKEWETIRAYEAGRPLIGPWDHIRYTFGLIDPAPGGVDRFVDSIDWGWFYFLTKPIFMMLHGYNALIGNMGVAIVVLTLTIKAILLPLAYKSYVSMARMKELQPEMEKLKEKAGDDRQKLQQGMMALYKDNKVNPAAGCLPILLQIPIFFSLYKVIFVTLELRHAPFFGPFQDLSAPDPTSLMNLFGLLPWAAPDAGTILALVFIGILPILLGISMWLQQKLNPAPQDPTQAMIFAWLPWVFMFMLGGFASGLVVYWIANNTITFTQQYMIMRSHGSKPDLFGNITSSFRRRAGAPAPKDEVGRRGAPKAVPGLTDETDDVVRIEGADADADADAAGSAPVVARPPATRSGPRRRRKKR